VLVIVGQVLDDLESYRSVEDCIDFRLVFPVLLGPALEVITKICDIVYQRMRMILQFFIAETTGEILMQSYTFAIMEDFRFELGHIRFFRHLQ